MISRRNVLQLGAGGLLAATSGGPLGSSNSAAAQPQLTHSASHFRQATGESGSQAQGPSLEKPIVVKWTFESNTEYRATPTIIDGVAYGSVAGMFAYALDAETGAELWTRSIDAGWSQPHEHEGQLFIETSNNRLLAIDPRSGEEQWFHDFASTIAMLQVSGGTAYVGVENGEVYALDTTTGAEMWTYFAGQTYSSPANKALVVDQTVFIAMGSPVLHALDVETGSQKWTFFTQGRSLLGPIVSNESIYVAGGEGVHAFDINSGDQLWHFRIDSPSSTGFVLRDGVLYLGLDSGPLYAIDAETGLAVWEFVQGEYGPRDIQVDNEICTFLIATGGQMFPYYNLHGVDRLTGELRWRTEDIWNQMLPTLIGDGTIVVGEYHTRATDHDHPLYALNSSTGSEIWRLVKPGGFTARPVAAGGNLYVGGGLGTIYCLGNLQSAVLVDDVTLRGAPSTTGIERGTAVAGSEISSIGARDSASGSPWVEVTIGGVNGWIPLDSIDPATLPPEGGQSDLEYVYTP